MLLAIWHNGQSHYACSLCCCALDIENANSVAITLPGASPLARFGSGALLMICKCRPALVVSVRVGGKESCDNKCALSHAPVARYWYSGEFPIRVFFFSNLIVVVVSF